MAGEEPRVEPLEPRDGPPSQRPGSGRRFNGSAVAAVVVGVAALAVLTRPGALPPATTTTMPSSTTSTEATTTTTIRRQPESPPPARDATLSELLPEAAGRLHVAVGDAHPVLLTFDGGRPAAASPLAHGFSFLRLDQSGRLATQLAYDFEGGGDRPVLDLHVTAPGDTLQAVSVAENVASAVWHASIPGRLAWISEGEAAQLCWADFDWTAAPPPAQAATSCFPTEWRHLVAFDDLGFIAGDGDRRFARLDPEGEVNSTVPGDDAVRGADGNVLLGLVGPYDDVRHQLLDPRLDPIGQPFAVAPYEFPSYVRVAAAAHHPARYAVMYPLFRGSRMRVEVFELDWPTRRLLGAFNLDARVWALAWDGTGRFLLAPGIVDERDHVLYVMDNASGETATLHFDDWVRDAALAVPARCEDASAIAEEWNEGLPGEVDLRDAVTAASRDPALEAWRFLSATLPGGERGTWALPGFEPERDRLPERVLAADENAQDLGLGWEPLDPAGYGMRDWRQFDGAMISRHCPTD